MLKQEYLRPHDVTVILALTLQPYTTFRELAAVVSLSLGETHNSVKRLELARLAQLGETPNVSGLLEFLISGVPYSFPAQLGPPTRGVPTAFSALPLNDEFISHDVVVWPDPKGDARGYSVTPLSPVVARISRQNADLYRLLALIDAVRIGQARERARARMYLEQEFQMMRNQWD